MLGITGYFNRSQQIPYRSQQMASEYADAVDVVKKEEQNYIRLNLLIVKLATFVLKTIFDHAVPPEQLHHKLQQAIKKINYGKTKNIINQKKYELLFPPQGPPNSKTFDISLLVYMLRNICDIGRNCKWWKENDNNKIADTEVDEVADIVRIRNIRNEIHHVPKASLDQTYFDARWTMIEEAMLRLGTKYNLTSLNSEIKTVKNQPIDSVKEKVIVIMQSHDLDDDYGQFMDDGFDDDYDFDDGGYDIDYEDDDIDNEDDDMDNEDDDIDNEDDDIDNEDDDIDNEDDDIDNEDDDIDNEDDDIDNEDDDIDNEDDEDHDIDNEDIEDHDIDNEDIEDHDIDNEDIEDHDIDNDDHDIDNDDNDDHDIDNDDHDIDNDDHDIDNDDHDDNDDGRYEVHDAADSYQEYDDHDDYDIGGDYD